MRITFLLQDLHHGGAVRTALSLAPSLEPVAFVIDGVHKHPKIVAEAKRFARVIELPYRKDANGKYSLDAQHALEVMQQVKDIDVLIAAGTGHLADLTVGLDCAKVLVSHVTPEWAEQAALIRKDESAATHRVAPSLAAAACFSRKATIIPHGVDPARVAPAIGREAQRRAWGLPQDCKIALYLGRFDPRIKKQDRLLDAMHHLPSEWRVVFLGCTGSPKEQQRMVEIARTEHPGRVVFAPEDAHVGDALAAADCLVITSDGESFSLVMFEAFLAGLPVVTARFPFIEEIERRHGGLLSSVPLGSHPRELAWAIAGGDDPGWVPHVKSVEAKHVTWREYTTTAMQHRWQKYLWETIPRWQAKRWRKAQCKPVGKREAAKVWATPRGDKPKVCYLGAYPQIMGGVETWLQTLIKHTDVEWSVAAYRTPGLNEVSLEILNSLGCPYHLDEMPTDCDLVLAWGLPFAARLLEGYPGKLAIVSHGGEGRWNRRWVQALEDRADYRIGVSKEATCVFSKESLVLYNGIDLERLKPRIGREDMRKYLGLKDDEIAAGFVGRLSEEKNPLLLAKAVEQLGKPFRAVYVGRDSTDFTKQIKAILPNAIFCKAEMMGDIYAALDSLLVSSPSEGFSLVTLEAMACSCPVVSTSVGVLPEIEEIHGQLAVPIPKDCDGKLAAKALLATGKPERRGIIERAREVALGFEASKMCAKWSEFLKGAVLKEVVNV
jgi:glycosyltransferase involved in cell wall biosynthesis